MRLSSNAFVGFFRVLAASITLLAVSCGDDSPGANANGGSGGGASGGPGAGGANTGGVGTAGTGGDAGAEMDGGGTSGMGAVDASSGGSTGGTGTGGTLGNTGGTGGGTNGPYGLTTREPLTTCSIGTTAPDTIDLTGCYADVTTQTPAAGLIPYDVNSPLWSDGAWKRRFIGVPGTSTIDFTTSGAWSLPEGTILVKEFWLERVQGDASSRFIVETRYLVKRGTTLQGVSYQWNDTQTNATLSKGGDVTYAIEDAGGNTTSHTHFFPPPNKCGDCHNDTAGGTLGLRTVQMNRNFDYDGVVDNQIRAMEHIGLFTSGPASSLDTLLSMPNPLDTSAPLESRARAYLEGNCAHCHHPGGPTPMTMDLRYETPFASTNTCNATPKGGDLGVQGALIIYAGDPSLSLVHLRMTRRGADQMPPLATYLVDTEAAAVLGSWIESLTGCP